MEIHEYIDFLLHELFDIQETDLTDLADDLIIGGYLLIFLIYIASKWQTLQPFQRSIFFKIGFILTLVMVVFDMASNNNVYVTSLFSDDPATRELLRQWLGIIEDSVKIFAEGMFIVGIH